jgi:hypothetical protein
MDIRIRLAQFAQSHGMRSVVTGSGIVVFVPWFNCETNERGETQVECQSLAELRAALGY